MADKFVSLLQNDISEEASLKYMLKLSAPMIVANISFTVMQFVNRLMVSRLGTNALAAILPAGMVVFMPASFALGVMTSVNTLVSQSLGMGQKKDCSNYCWQVTYMGLIYIVIVGAIMWPAAPAIFKMMGHEPAVADMEVIYLRIMLYTQIFAVFTWSSNQFFMGIHRPIITMYSTLCAQIVNVAANYLLIFGKFGFPKMGIAGAAWGTFIGVGIEAGIKMAMFLTGNTNKNFKGRQTINIDFNKMISLLKIGLPAGLGLMINVAFWGLILLGQVGRFGKEALAATGAVISCTNVSIMPIVGIGTALTAAVGKTIGGGMKELAIKQTNICLKVALVYIGLIGICFFVFRNSLMACWTSDDKVIAAGVNILICAAIFQIFDTATIIYSSSLRGAGDTVWLAIASALGAGVILGLGGFLMVRFFPEFGPIGPWTAAIVSIIVVGLANRWRFKSNKWMRINLFKRRPVGLTIEVEAVVE